MSSENTVSFSAREMETLALAWQCFESDPKIDYKKLCKLTGYTEGSAKTTIGNLKRKLRNHAAGLTSDGTTSTPKKSTGGPGRSKKRVSSEDGADGTDESPTKKKKATPRKAKAKLVDDDDEEFKELKIKSEEVEGLGADEYGYNSGANLFGSYGQTT